MRNQGFTFLELSVVLFIIAMIVGGVVLGQDMVRAAQVRRAIQDTQSIRSAVAAFKDQYGCLPGDCRNQSTLFSLAADDNFNVQNGNGNGQYEFGGFDDCAEGMRRVWEVLGKSGFFPGSYTGVSSTPGTDNFAMVPGVDSPLFSWFQAALSEYQYYGVGALPPKNMVVMLQYSYPCPPGVNNGCEMGQPQMDYNQSNSNRILYMASENVSPNFNPTPMGGFKCDFAYAIDKKMDDGVPLTGNVKAPTESDGGGGASVTCAARRANTEASANDPTAVYNFDDTRSSPLAIELMQ